MEPPDVCFDGDEYDMPLSYGGVSFHVKEPTVNQDVILHLAKLSNFNVVMQSRTTLGGYRNQIRLLCEKCNASEMITMFNDIKHSEATRKFCEAHAHATPKAPIEELVGRKFREE